MMQNNLKLKRAVAIALGVFALGAQQQVLALGLGDISVQSHLGQALRAKVKIHDASDLKLDDGNSSACFKLGFNDDGSVLTGINFKLGAVSNDEAMLMLSTTQVVNDPILNLAIIAECGAAMRRDYVVLLDPILTAESENVADEALAPVADTVVVEAKKPAKKHQQLADSGTNASVVKKSRGNKKSSKNKVLNTSTNANIVLHVPGGSDESQTNAVEKNTQKASQPRLSVSAGEPSAAPLISSNLRLERQLTFTPDANAQAPVVDADIQDEVTAMNNRLAHLSAQVAKLQSRNLVLESDNKLKSQQISETESSRDKLRWLGFVLGAALLFVSGQLIRKWYWRREYENQIALSEAALENMREANIKAGKLDEEGNFLEATTRHMADTVDEKSASEGLGFEPTLNSENPIVIEEEAQDLSILDHADVFLSHGRTSLAIQLLQNHLLDHPKQSITIWLFLLDLLSKENLQTVYEQTALECKEHFNVKISGFAKGDKSANQNLESFPHLAEGLQEVWGTPASVVYLDDLIYNNRLEPRAGLDKSLIDELLLLKSIAQESVNSAEVIQLDEKKIALQEQKDALLAAKKAEKLQKMDEAFELEQTKANAGERLYEFNLVDWK